MPPVIQQPGVDCRCHTEPCPRTPDALPRLWKKRSAPLGEGVLSLEYRSLLPERFEVDLEKRYILDKLAFAEGGYGKVFVARDSKFENRLVAVKKLTKLQGSTGEEAHQEEIRIMRELDHPCICRLFESLERGRHLYFVMEYCEGGELFGKIIERGFITEACASEIAKQVASALLYAHGRRIAHRDVKPENIVFCSKDPNDLRIKVIDWGLAVSFAGSEMRAAVGSFAYSAPEVMMSAKTGAYTCLCDMWSLGVTTYVMLCGKPPFWGTPQRHLKRAKAEQYPMEDAPWDSVSDECKDFVRKLLKANPHERLSSEDALSHPWLVSSETRRGMRLPEATMKEVMQNMAQFRDSTIFMQLCTVAVACQLDHKDLKEIHQVFQELDSNGDGTLSLEEVASSWRTIFGDGSEEAEFVKETFQALDLNGSGAVDYTEFCAAGLGHAAAMKADAVWSAFKLFDLDDNERLTVAEIQSVLQQADIKHVWTDKVCNAVAKDLVSRYDENGNGYIEFEEFLRAMQDSWLERIRSSSSAPALPFKAAPLGLALDHAYSQLAEAVQPEPRPLLGDARGA